MPPESTPIPAEEVVQKGRVKVNSRAPRQNLVWLAGPVRYSEPCALSGMVSASLLEAEQLKSLLRPSACRRGAPSAPQELSVALCWATSQPTWLPSCSKGWESTCIGVVLLWDEEEASLCVGFSLGLA